MLHYEEYMVVKVSCYFDSDVQHWGFSVTRLGIIGRGAATREEAEERDREAILFTLEGDAWAQPLPEVETGYMRVTVEPVTGAEAEHLPKPRSF